MVTVAYGASFERTIRTIRDVTLKERLKAQIIRIVKNPEIGKPMRYSRKHTREVYISLQALLLLRPGKKTSWFSWLFTTIFLALYHEDEQ